MLKTFFLIPRDVFDPVNEDIEIEPEKEQLKLSLKECDREWEKD